jgi:hypothetical protein
VRHAERESTISLLIKCDAGGDAEQIRETVNTGRLHAWVEHNPNFIGSVRRCCSSLMTRHVFLFLSHSMHRSRSASLSLT